MSSRSKLYLRSIIITLLAMNAIAGALHLFTVKFELHLAWFIFPTLASIALGFLIAKNGEITQALAVQSTTDSLTKLFNRRFLNDTLEHELARCNRYKKTFSLIQLDIDHFKKINDQYGHSVGDNVLITIAAMIKANCRDSDIIARWGGEEFMVLLPNAGLSDAEEKTESLRTAISAHTFASVGKVTCSFGIAERNWIENENRDQVTHRVDIALYKAKSQGENCIKTSYYAVDKDAQRPTS